MRRSTSRRCVAPCETALTLAEHRAHEPASALSPPDRHRQDQGALSGTLALADRSQSILERSTRIAQAIDGTGPEGPQVFGRGRGRGGFRGGGRGGGSGRGGAPTSTASGAPIGANAASAPAIESTA